MKYLNPFSFFFNLQLRLLVNHRMRPLVIYFNRSILSYQLDYHTRNIINKYVLFLYDRMPPITSLLTQQLCNTSILSTDQFIISWALNSFSAFFSIRLDKTHHLMVFKYVPNTIRSQDNEIIGLRNLVRRSNRSSYHSKFSTCLITYRPAHSESRGVSSKLPYSIRPYFLAILILKPLHSTSTP